MDYNNVYDINKRHAALREELLRESTVSVEPKWFNIYWDPDIRQDYLISDQGVVWDAPRKCEVKLSPNQYGDIRANVSLADGSGYKTISVRNAVAQAFVECPSGYFTTALIKNNVQTDLYADNIVWRPGGFGRKYREQFEDIPRWFHHGPVIQLCDDEPSDIEYDSVFEAAKDHGIMAKAVYDSCELEGEPCMFVDVGFQWF